MGNPPSCLDRSCSNFQRTQVRRTAYAPYGEIIDEDIYTAAVPAETKGFIGERYDTAAGLQYLNARYYDPALGIFIQPDWWEVTNPGVGTNRYMYALGDPVNLSDPNGNVVPIAIAAVALVALAASTDPANAPGDGDEILQSNGDRNMIIGAAAAGGIIAAPGIAASCLGNAICRAGSTALTVTEVVECGKGDVVSCATPGPSLTKKQSISLDTSNRAIFEEKKFEYLFGRVAPDPHNTPSSYNLSWHI